MHFVRRALILRQEPVVPLADAIKKTTVIVVGIVADSGGGWMTGPERIVNICIRVCTIKDGLLVGILDNTSGNGLIFALLFPDASYRGVHLLCVSLEIESTGLGLPTVNNARWIVALDWNILIRCGLSAHDSGIRS